MSSVIVDGTRVTMTHKQLRELDEEVAKRKSTREEVVGDLLRRSKAKAASKPAKATTKAAKAADEKE